jgi:hypothetical protein
VEAALLRCQFVFRSKRMQRTLKAIRSESTLCQVTRQSTKQMCSASSARSLAYSSRRESRDKKAAGEADSFPCRLINYLWIPLQAKGEAPVLVAAAVSESDAVPQ